MGAWGVVGLAAIATGLSTLGDFGWRFTFLEHFRMQYSLILLLGLGMSLWDRRRKSWRYGTRLWRLALFLLLPLLMNVVLLAPLWLPAGTPQGITTTTPRLRLLYMTLDHERSEVRPAVAYIQQQRADVIFLLEVTPTSLTALQQQLGDSHRLVFGLPRTNSHGSAWFVPRQSRLTIAGAEIIHLPSFSDRPLLKGTLMHNGRPLDLLLFHAIRPRHEASVAFQRQEFAALANWSRTVANELIVFGDFNSTPWHGQFRQMLAISGLRNSQVGFGWQTTWPSQLPPPFRLAIDHSLHSPRITTLGRQVGPDIGSDHLPLMLEFGLPS